LTDEPQLRCRIAAVIIQYLSPADSADLPALAAARNLDVDKPTHELFKRAYDVYEKFSFESPYPECRTVSWLGRTHLDRVPGEPEVGSVTTNHVLVKNLQDGTTALHQHLTLSGDVELDGVVTPSTAAATRTLHELFWQEDSTGEPTAWAVQADPFHAQARRDSSGPFSRRAIYVSLVLPDWDAALMPEWHQIAVPLYGFLNLHAEGMNPAGALSSLEDCAYSSTDFFVGFIHADAAVSLAVPYPHAGIVDPWPTLMPTTSTEAEAVTLCWNRRIDRQRSRFEDYDLSPEYPALRYNAMTLLEFAGKAVYGEWQIRRELDRAMNQRWPLGLISALAASRRIDRTYFKARSLDMLRLRVVREVAIRLVSTNEMEEPERAIEGLRASLTNGLLALLAAAAVLVAVVQILIALFPH
jgi:hypothetical protein